MKHTWLASLLFPGFAFCALAQANRPTPQQDVFVIGRETAVGDPLAAFQPTRVELSTTPMTIADRRELTRMLLAEQGFAHRPLPLGAPGLTMFANGRMTVTNAALQSMEWKKGICAATGDHVMITGVSVEHDRLVVDVNGGPYPPHRFLRHVYVNDMPVAGDGILGEGGTGTRITLLFEGETPKLTAAEVKSLLEPLVDFHVKSSDEAYAAALPPELTNAIGEHRLLVGMSRRMVLAAAGQPDSKLRERAQDSTTGEVFEEWMYGRPPEPVRFVRFRGNRVVRIQIAEPGKPMEVRDKDELAGYRDPAEVHLIAMGDKRVSQDGEDSGQGKAPSLIPPQERSAAQTGSAKGKRDDSKDPIPPAIVPPSMPDSNFAAQH